MQMHLRLPVALWWVTTIIIQIWIIFVLFQAAEDGRKRATALPPLEREPTFHRKPKYFNQYEGNTQEVVCV